MKIGILTFHCAHNYGAVLQCYALQEHLKSLGHDVYVIDYRPSYITHHRDYVKFNPRFLFTKKIKFFPRVFYTGLKLATKRNRRWSFFSEFINNKLNLYSADQNFKGEGFDLCIVGSDQIWSKRITGGRFDQIYFGLHFKCPVVSYAASTITKEFSEDDKLCLKSLLLGFKDISVREQKLSEQLSEILNFRPKVVLDPTLLADKAIYDSLTDGHSVNSSNRSIPNKYILVYTVIDHDGLHIFAENISKKMNLPIVEIASNFNLKRYQNKIYDASVVDFLSLIKNATYVITNSFHGSVFSVLFQKNFYAIRQNNEVDERLRQLLNSLNLEKRFLNFTDVANFDQIDYIDVLSCLEIRRKESSKFLNAALS